MLEQNRYNRRHFLSNAAKLIAVGPLAVIGSADDYTKNINLINMDKNIAKAKVSFEKIILTT